MDPPRETNKGEINLVEYKGMQSTSENIINKGPVTRNISVTGLPRGHKDKETS